jgi:hypothetical protein
VPGDILQLIIGLQAIPIPFGDPPGRARILFQRLEAFFLALLGEMKPELKDQRTFIDQHRFKAIDLVDPRIQCRLGHLADQALADRFGIP